MHSGTSRVAGPATGHVRWIRDLGANVTPGPVVGADGTIYAATNSGVLHALDPTTGLDRWTFDGVRVRDGHLVRRVQGMGRHPAGPSSIGIWTSPAIDRDGNLYFGTRPGHIYGFAADGRRILDINAHATVDSYPAIAADGTLLIGATNGTLYAIGDR